MRRCETTSRVLLILSIVSFALAAPVAVRDIHKVRVDMADVTKHGTGASQLLTRKRFDPWALLSTTNAADRTSVPRTRSPAGDSEYADHRYAQSPSASQGTSIASNLGSSPAWSTGSNYAQSTGSNHPPPTPDTPSGSDGGTTSPGSPSGSHGGGSPEYETSPSHGDPPYVPVWDSDRFTLSSEWALDASRTASPESVHGPPPPPSPGPAPSPDGRPPPNPGLDAKPPLAEHEPESFLDMLLKGKIRRSISAPVAVHAAQRELQDNAADPGPTTDPAKNVDTLATSATGGVVGRGADVPLVFGLPYHRLSRRKA